MIGRCALCGAEICEAETGQGDKIQLDLQAPIYRVEIHERPGGLDGKEVAYQIRGAYWADHKSVCRGPRLKEEKKRPFTMLFPNGIQLSGEELDRCQFCGHYRGLHNSTTNACMMDDSVSGRPCECKKFKEAETPAPQTGEGGTPDNERSIG